MFSTTLALRLTEGGVGLVVVGFFAWVTLLPTFKFLWAPLVDRYAVPGFARYWGKRRGWIMLAQIGIVASLVAMAVTGVESLALTALFAVQQRRHPGPEPDVHRVAPHAGTREPATAQAG